MLNYSFIIPHKNNLKLLKRCIASIPQRADIEVIVVDDASDNLEKPYDLRADVRVLYIESIDSMGAGKARNIGLREAKGKWILFADCDDYYDEGFIVKLDKLINSDYDVCFFDSHFKIDPQRGVEFNSPRYKYIQEYLSKPQSKKRLAFLKHCDNCIWSRMFSKKFLDQIGAVFEEIYVANDIYFAHYTSVKSKKVFVMPDKLYCYVKNEGSLTFSRNTKVNNEIRLYAGFRLNKLVAQSENVIALPIIFPLNRYKSSLRNFGLIYFIEVLWLHFKYDVSIFTVLYWKIRALLFEK